MQKYLLQANYQIQVVIIGTGKVASALGSALHDAGLNIAGVCGRNALRAEILASMLGTKTFHDAKELPPDAGIYILAVSDDAVAEVSEQLGAVNGIVVHVSGSLPAGILSSVHKRYGVFYPLQTFTEGRHIDLNEVPFFIQAGHPDDLKILCTIAGLLSNNVIESSDQMRAQLHISAVFASNFVNALYVISAGLLESKAIDFSILHPLIRETALKATTMSPSLAQTGPARRDDRKAIEKHLRLLDNHPREKAVYIELTNFLLEKYHGKTL